MIRGTTPILAFKLPIDVSDVTKIRVYFRQGSEPVLIKDESDCEYGENTIYVHLTEEETLALSAKKRLETKMRFVMEDDAVLGTMPIYIDVVDTGNNELLLNGAGSAIPLSKVYIYTDVMNLAEDMGWTGVEDPVSDVDMNPAVIQLAVQMGWISN
jgi:hypothetical protein